MCKAIMTSSCLLHNQDFIFFTLDILVYDGRMYPPQQTKDSDKIETKTKATLLPDGIQFNVHVVPSL